MKRLLGIDVGTTSLKAGLYDENLNEIGSATVDYTLDTVGDRVEFDAEEYLRLLLRGMKEACGGIRPDAISLDTQCETMILTDGEGRPLRPAIVWLDNRAAAQAEAIERAFGRETVYNKTGQPEVAAAWPACKLLWVKENEPEVWAATKKIFLLGDWLAYRLTGRFVTEGTLQSSSLYFDITKGDWWEEMLDYVGITRQMLPEIRKSTEKVGEYEGIPFVMGAMDQVAGAVGCGTVKPGTVSEMTGTTLAVFAPCEGIPPFRADSIIPCHYHYDGSYCRLLWTSAAGLALKWFRENFCADLSFRDLDREAAQVPPGSDGVTFVPHLCGSTMPVCNPTATAAFCGVSLRHTRAHFARAVMEAVAFMLKECLDTLDTDIKQIRSSGGGSQSPFWCGIKADVIGKEVVTMTKKETATLGSAIFAGVGIGVFPSVPEAAEKIQEGKRYLPTGQDYTEAFRRYLDYGKRVNER